MFESQFALLEAIRLGESTYLECKEVRFAGSKIRGPSRDTLANLLAAFANARGGTLVLGVDDKSHAIIGIPVDQLDQTVDFVRHVCRDSINPPIENIALERLRVPSETGDLLPVIKVEVPRSLFVHKSPGGYMLRVADSIREMSTAYLARLLQQRSQTRLIRFDEQTVPDAGLDDLTISLWQRFRTSLSEDDRTDFLVKLGMARPDEDGFVRPTVAGILMASENPRKWLPNAFIQAVAYQGDSVRVESSKAYQLDAKDIVGPLDQQVIDACRFVSRNMRTAAFKSAGYLGRRDLPQFDIRAVFEALVNAVVHRDYSVYGSKIRLRLFANRLEISSPGDLVNSMNIKSLRHIQVARNEYLCSLLTKCRIPDEAWLATDRTHFMEKRGEGVPIILDESERLSGRAPEYGLIDHMELMLTIFAAGD